MLSSPIAASQDSSPSPAWALDPVGTGVKHIFFIKVLLQKKKIVLFIIVDFSTINLLGRAWSHTL